MTLIELAKKRYSARKYKRQPVGQPLLLQVLEAGRVAPTACNNQPQRILVIRSAEGMEKLAGACRTFGAPAALIICADRSETWKRSYDRKDSGDTDAAIVTDHMMLCAADLGLASVWIGSFDPSVLRKAFYFPSEFDPVSILLLGYADGEPPSPDRHVETRKPLGETVFFDAFSGGQNE